MKMKKIILFALCFLMLVSCGKTYKDISLSSFEFVSLAPKGERSGEALIKLGLNNPIQAFELTDINGILKIGDTACVSIHTDQLMISGKCDKVYSVPFTVSIPEGANLFELLKVLKTNGVPEISIDFSARPALRGGIGVKIKGNYNLSEKMQMGGFVSSVIGKSFKDLKVTDFELCEVNTANSVDSCQVLMKFGLVNPYIPFELSSVSGKLQLNGIPGINITDKDLTVVKKGEGIYYLTFDGELASGFNPCLLLNLLKQSGQPSLTADLSVRLALRGGIGKTFTWKNIVLVSPK